jgi:hypothetical protein
MSASTTVKQAKAHLIDHTAMAQILGGTAAYTDSGP